VLLVIIRYIWQYPPRITRFGCPFTHSASAHGSAHNNDKHAPEFLYNTHLDKTRVIEQVIKAIKEATSRLPSPGANKESKSEEGRENIHPHSHPFSSSIY
jgi:hypothetical protein